MLLHLLQDRLWLGELGKGSGSPVWTPPMRHRGNKPQLWDSPKWDIFLIVSFAFIPKFPYFLLDGGIEFMQIGACLNMLHIDFGVFGQRLLV
jgi:hypothetical protein